MAITNSLQDREFGKFKESTAVAGQAGVVVINPDGSSIGAGGGGGGGGGTQYTEGGAAVALATGNAIMVKDSANLEHQVSPTWPLYAYIQDAPTPTTGTITSADVASTTTAGLNGQNLITGTPTSGSSVVTTFSGENSVTVQVTGNFVGTYMVERSMDNGTTWTSASGFSAGNPTSTFVAATAGSANAMLHFNAAGANQFRVRATVFTSGTATVKLLAGAGAFPLSILSPLQGQYKSTPPTYNDGSTGAMQMDVAGNQKQNMATRLDPINDLVTALPFGHAYSSISTATTTTVKSGSGVLNALTLAGGTAGAITVYDNTAGSGNLIIPAFTPGSVSVPVTLPIDVAFNTGLTIVTAAATVLSVSYR